MGRPILFYGGEEGKPDDYLIAINAIRNLFPALSAGEAAVLMGHGGLHPANAAYGALQVKLADAGLENVFVYTVEGFPSLAEVIKKLKTDNIKKVVLIPFMLVAGAHVMNDMIGDDKDSARSQVVSAGIEVRAYLQGMGENAAIQDIYIQHLKDIIDED
ncbi:sirohydrochlorin cobaltochelatase CbiKP precursor [Methylomusa anaerophila]|uniref:Sirohydrochlorin cobaltochelatase CbiKP n=1 Tax=Methylomusa anaerophila TaxID=1930071 RepID=A0A348AR27_9FIRM|nr:sirohydrochlorin cobaltochelatase CbiKP precursor [Methylomusa anaerophila]